MEPGCDVCVDILKNKNDIPILESNILTLDVQANVINPPFPKLKGSEKTTHKGYRDHIIWKLKKYISALRNTQGGALHIHVNNIDPSDSCLEYFHELIDDRLNTLIEDGSLFVATYTIDWLSESDLTYLGYVAIIVQPSVSVVTLDYHTKIPLDNSIETPSTLNIAKIIREGMSVDDTTVHIRGLGSLHESRHKQVKAFFTNFKNGVLLVDEEKLTTYLWENLKLGQYISAFSKVDGGGSFFLGIEEQEKPYPEYGYASKELRVTGFPCGGLSQSVIEAKLKNKVETNTLLLVKDQSDIKSTKPQNIIEVAFHSVSSDTDIFVLEVAVAAVDGLLFCDKEGPEAYEIDHSGELKRLDVQKWCARVMKIPTSIGEHYGKLNL